ncbi:hypothetical protein PF005_g28429 [Phytophthora fragariae]|uniref:Uncharacterized protein n=1 Tax=Phytophthora fragariae TaxID=53985 RepID=A0A6A3VVZ3_9STRA|nr:hypothetical protein PF003_g3743 [Phytophthora fragariae]KAE8920381.1 hypothetical protein PF009_g29324 [Phytophthora fragariae]KAE9060262.1 hypothetical protein PF006_g31686 [Phytophthora fragariae]KAE9168325.1 hypothetical protein PF005_g28429 [Phytophthora fragariae]KAE9174536.1 hypothetical protein PF002_g29023 [Phytophthora fragariae]
MCRPWLSPGEQVTKRNGVVPHDMGRNPMVVDALTESSQEAKMYAL